MELKDVLTAMRNARELLENLGVSEGQTFHDLCEAIIALAQAERELYQHHSSGAIIDMPGAVQ